jgi:hypothetical protein
MTPTELTYEYHRDRALELLEMANTVLGDEGMPKDERVMELDRLLRRLAGHQASMEIAIEDLPF